MLRETSTTAPFSYGDELATRRDLISSEPDHSWAGNCYYPPQLGPPEHKLVPTIGYRWRRGTFSVTSVDRFMGAVEGNDVFEQVSPVGELNGRLIKLGILVERELWIAEERIAYIVDLGLPLGEDWLPLTFGDLPGPTGSLRFAARAVPDTNFVRYGMSCGPRDFD